MPATLADYQEIVGEGVIEELRVVADRVRGRSMQHINSTAVGGGVAEILTRLVPLMNELGIHASWDVIFVSKRCRAGTDARRAPTRIVSTGVAKSGSRCSLFLLRKRLENALAILPPMDPTADSDHVNTASCHDSMADFVAIQDPRRVE